MRYSSRREAIEQAIRPALDGTGDEFDMDAIFDQAFAWKTDYDRDGNELLNRRGFEQTVSVEEFWQIASRNAR